MRLTGLLSSLHEHGSSSVQLGAAKFVEVVVAYFIFSGADFFPVFLRNKHKINRSRMSLFASVRPQIFRPKFLMRFFGSRFS